MAKCSADGCDREVRARGFCFRHYMRLRRTGSLATKRYVGGFWEKVQRGGASDCWPWLGYRKASGHGLTSHKSLMIHASRKAWILTHGEIRDELCVNHTCDNAICCNPDHMYLGTRAENMADYWGVTPVEEIYKARQGGASLRECAERFGLHISTICRVVTKRRREKLEKLRKVRLSATTRDRV